MTDKYAALSRNALAEALREQFTTSPKRWGESGNERRRKWRRIADEVITRAKEIERGERL